MRLWIQKSLACVPSAAALGLLVETTAVASSEPLTFHLPATLSTAAEDRPQLQSGELEQPIAVTFQLPLVEPPLRLTEHLLQIPSIPIRRLSVPPGAPPISTETGYLPPPPSWPADAAMADSSPTLQSLFREGPQSLAARAVGSAEGTRTPEGRYTLAYYGHIDPGNGAWNLGSFSYQHGAATPEVADHLQLQRLRDQAETLQALAQAKEMQLTLGELLNGIDLANQAPRAALDRGGYIDWLHHAQQMGLEEEAAIAWARTRSFLDPDSGRWNAPGLNNDVRTISADQERRQQAIARAVAADSALITSKQLSEELNSPEPTQATSMEAIVDIAINLDLDMPDP